MPGLALFGGFGVVEQILNRLFYRLAFTIDIEAVSGIPYACIDPGDS